MSIHIYILDANKMLFKCMHTQRLRARVALYDSRHAVRAMMMPAIERVHTQHSSP